MTYFCGTLYDHNTKDRHRGDNFMIDFHSHVLPAIDDGSRDMEETRRLIAEGYRQGVTCQVATPHFYADRDSYHKYIGERAEKYRQMKEELEAVEHPAFRLGAEVHYFTGIGDADILDSLCIEGTNVLLLEMPFIQWDDAICKDVKKIIEKRKLTVLLAHIERYYDFQKNKSAWKDILELPLYIQINTGSFLNRRKKKFVLKFLKKHDNVVLGSDCHNMERRPPNLAEGRQVIAEKLGEQRLEQIDELGKRILN